MKAKTTKRALLMSALSLLLCISMLVGTTFAWFTDSVQSGINQIVAGNLDVEVYYGDPAAEQSIESVNTLFDDVTLWEPGAMAWEQLTVKNVGSLALKYNLSINFDNAVATPAGKTLADVLQIAVLDETPTRENIKGAELQPLKSFALQSNGVIEANAAPDTFFVAIYWAPSANDNDYNMNNGETTVLSIDLGVKLIATQATVEEDSFDKTYDAGAPWTGGVSYDWYTDDPTAAAFTVDTPDELAGLAAIVNGTATVGSTYSMRSTPVTLHDTFAGKTVKLGADLDLSDLEWTPIGRTGTTTTDFTYAFKGTFDGQGHTVYNLKVNNEGWAGLFGIAHSATLKNVKISGVTLNSHRMSGALVGQLYGSIDACHVEKATITVIPNWVGNAYDNGDKVGGLVGWLGDNGNNRTLTNCTATDVTLAAYRDVGGIAGYVASSTKVNGNKVAGIDITVDQITYSYGKKAVNAGAIWGRDAGLVAGSNTEEEYSVAISYQQDGVQYKEDGEGAVTLHKVPENYAGTKVTVPEGVTNVGSYAFAYNQNIEEIVLPSTVTTLNDRAFRDTSASKVVLNEGLTNISYQAFRNATNVTEVVIPSTVTTISKEAFQSSGVTALTVPASVTTIEYGAMRDMKQLETVTIHGDADIPVYAFRACTNLKKVVLTGDDVTFGGGSRGMIFTNKENGDGSAITVYVANETVKARLLAADTAAKDYGGYQIVVMSAVEDATDLSASINAGEGTLLLGAGTYEMPSVNGNKEFTIVGTEDTVIDLTMGAYMEGSKVSFEGVTIKGSTGKANGNGSDYAALYTPNVTYTNCVFEGPFRVGRDGATFINCTFNNLGNDYVWNYGNDVTFTGCTFNSEGKALLLYSDGGNEVAKVKVENCVFNATKSAKAGAIANQSCAAIEIDNYGNGVELTVAGNTVDSDFSGEWRIKSYNAAKPKVIVNGTEYTTLALDGKTMTIDSNKNVTVNG